MFKQPQNHLVNNRQQQYGLNHAQLLPTTYIDRYSVLEKLEQRFGPNNFKIQVCLPFFGGRGGEMKYTDQWEIAAVE